LFILLGLQSCKNKLSRSHAEDEIVKKMELPINEEIIIKKKYFVDHQQVMGFGMVCFPSSAPKFSEYENMLMELQNKGYINLKKDQFYNECNDLYTNVELTDKGKKDLLKENEGNYEVKLCEICFGEITGIIEYNEFQVADVKYSLIRKNYTEFGLILSNNIKENESYEKSASFNKYDDGWRIESGKH